jgi:4-amino-4-deoxy-L-arabinose transferase-like glycosyltransferase
MKPVKVFAIFALVTAILSLAVVFATGSHIKPHTSEYEEVIANIFAGKGFVLPNVKFQLDYRAAIHPLFTYICAGIYALTGHSFLAVLIFQIFISILTSYLIFKLGSVLFNEKAGLIAAVLTMLHPAQVIYSTTKIHSQVLDTFFFVLIVYYVLLANRSRKTRHFVLLGIFAGVGSLARGTLIVLIPIAAVYLLLNAREKAAAVFRNLCLTAIAAVLVLSPWWVRNYMIFKKPVYMTTESTGYVMWVGFNENATGTLYKSPEISLFEGAPKEFQQKVWDIKDEMGQQEYFRKEAIGFIRQHPAKALRLYLNRVAYFWWFTPTEGSFYPKAYSNIYMAYYSAVVLLSAVGIIAAFKRRLSSLKDIIFLAGAMFLLGLLQSFYYVEGRHRWEIEPVLLVFAAYGISRFFPSWRRPNA